VVAPEQGRIEVAVLDGGGSLIRTITRADVEEGIIPFEWDGRDDAGEIVPPGGYTFHLRVLEPEPASIFVETDREQVEVVASLPGPETASVLESPAVGTRGSVLRGSGWIALSNGTSRALRRIDLFDVAGRSVRTLEAEAGATRVWWDGRDGRGQRVPAGLYFSLTEEDCAASRTLLLR
jgi:flagellar hook assembly protein FlgD